MKILRKKSLIILLPIIVMIGVVVAYQFYHSSKQEKVKTLTDEEIRQKYIEILSCTPEEPIDKKVIFAEAMKQYWQYRMDDLWTQDKTHNEVHNFGYQTNVVERHCGLKFDKKGKPLEITKETCYPWVTPYKDLEELFQALVIQKWEPQNTPEKYLDSAFRQRMYSLNAKPYQPEIDSNIYMGEQNFSIIKRDYVTYTSFYPADCCRLLSYQDIDEKIENYKEYSDYFLHIISPLLPKQVLGEIYFLEIKVHSIDSVQEDFEYEGLGFNLRTSDYDRKDKFFESKKRYGYHYYPVSLCGKGVFSPSSLQ